MKSIKPTEIKKGDIVMTGSSPDSVTPLTKIEILDGYKNRNTRLCKVPLFYDNNQFDIGSVYVKDFAYLMQGDDMIPIVE